MNSKVFEICPFCGKEVELDDELKVQKCPNCGKHIVTCSMCLAVETDPSTNYCQKCPLIVQATEYNKTEEEQDSKIKYHGVTWWKRLSIDSFIKLCEEKNKKETVIWKVLEIEDKGETLYMNNWDGEMYLVVGNCVLLTYM